MTPVDKAAMQRDLLAAEQRIKAHATKTAHDLQTEVLRGLEAFARGNFARFRSLESVQADLNTRVAGIANKGRQVFPRASAIGPDPRHCTVDCAYAAF
jgi:hypothetical protein